MPAVDKIWVIQRNDSYRDHDNRDATKRELEEDFGFFTEAEAAVAKCNELNAVVLSEYEYFTLNWKRLRFTHMLSFYEWTHYAGRVVYEPVTVEKAS